MSSPDDASDRAAASAPAMPARRRFLTAPRLLLALIALMLAYTLSEKFSAVSHFMPMRGWALADFLRINLAYAAFVLVWSHVLLASRKRAVAARAIAVTLVLHVATLDLANTEIIRFTGALAPSDAAYYMARASEKLPLTILSTELLTLVVIPLFFLGAGFFGWRQLRANAGKRRSNLVAAAAATLLAAALAPPVARGLELDKTRPSYLYHVAEYLARKTVRRPAPVADPLFAAAPAVAAPAGLAGGAPKRNLVVIVLESIGASATSLYNPSLPGTTPLLETLAASSWVAERAYAVIPHTSKALVAINCGRTPFPYHPIFESTLGVPGACLGHLLGGQGYATAFFQAPTRHFENREGLVEQLGFEHFVSGDQLDKAGFQLANYFGYEEEILMAPSAEWLQRRDSPFFAMYMTGATHHPYWSPDRYGYRVFDSRNFEYDSYLNSVRYLDHFLRNLLQQYRQLGLYENTVFVIVGDHGEGMGQHNRLQHNASMYQEVLQVPLLIHAPGLLPGSRSAEVFSQVDLLPSLLSLLGYPLASPGAGEGVDHFSQAPLAAPRETATASCWFEYWCTATIGRRYKHIYNFDLKPDELYDLENDPHEHRNLAASEPVKVAELRRLAISRYESEVGRWHAFLSAKEKRYWARREATLGQIAPLQKLPADDRRLTQRRLDQNFDF